MTVADDILQGDGEVAALFLEARSLHEQGDLAQANTLYGVVLGRAPLHADALHMRGLLALQWDGSAFTLVPPEQLPARGRTVDWLVSMQRLPADRHSRLLNVMRLAKGDGVRLFNGQDGEWLCYIAAAGKKHVSIRCERKVSDVVPPPDIDYVFAPLKHARLDYVVQKATELGARRLRPVITQRTIAERVNLERMTANVIEAAEQCNLVFVPAVMEPVKLPKLLLGWEQGRALVYCDETAAIASPPLKRDITTLAKPNSAFEMPPWVAKLPIRMKSGITLRS